MLLYQRARFMLLPRTRLRSATVKRLLLLLPVLVVAVPVQLSPPLMTMPVPPGSSSWLLQKMSVPAPLGNVRWLLATGSHTL